MAMSASATAIGLFTPRTLQTIASGRWALCYRKISDVRATVELCRKHGAPITSRGEGTSLSGQTIGSGVIIDFSRYMNKILELDFEQRRARVEPGCILDL